MQRTWMRHTIIFGIFVFLSLSFGKSPCYETLQKLRVSDDGHFLVRIDGSPFVWIGDTNWFFAKLSPDQITKILDQRKDQGFSVMQISCREKLYNGSGPGPITAPNEQWWNYLDWYVAESARRELYVGLTLGWFQVAKKNNPEDLFEFGRWVGDRYRDQDHIIWMTLGEAGGHLRNERISQEKLRALTDGIRAGDTGNKLLTVHADYQRGTSLGSEAFWCDFNNWQTSQWCCPDNLPRKEPKGWTVWDAIQHDYEKLYDGRPKPTLDAEAWYENNKDFCGATEFHIRRRAYFTLFAGACGHSYGAGGVWDGLIKADSCSKPAIEALDYPGVQSVSHLSALLHRLGNHFLSFIPDQSIITSENSDDYDRHLQAVQSKFGDFALIYSPSDIPFEINLTKLEKNVNLACWYNPRTNEYQPKKEIRSSQNHRILVDPPGDKGTGNDWVLMIGSEAFFESVRIH